FQPSTSCTRRSSWWRGATRERPTRSRPCLDPISAPVQRDTLEGEQREGASMAETVGFIGLGAMGAGMAANLLRAGYALVVNDIDAAKVSALVARGARAAADAADVARLSTRTVTMVETTAQTEEVILGPRGIIAGAGRGHVVAMMSTIDPN